MMAGMVRDRSVYENYNRLSSWIQPVERSEQRADLIAGSDPEGQLFDERAQRMLELFLNDQVGTPFCINRMRLSLVLWVLRIKLMEKTKRLFDLFFALGSLPLMLPLMGLIAIVIRLDSPGPVLFRQVRVGKWGKQFHCYKFRSMVVNAERLKADLIEQNEADEVVFKMRKDPRVTRVGEIIRKLSIDELPQIFNVLKGDMSLVGPRPPVPIELEYYQYEYFGRLDVVPGLTGLQQISGRSDLPFKRWVELDLIYIREQSILKDLEIILRTIPAVISRKGAY